MSFVDKFAQTYKRLLPTPFSIAILLTALTFLLALIFTKPADTGVGEYTLTLAGKWEEGLWNESKGGLYFAFQMMLMLVLGHILALTKSVSAIIDRITAPCTTTANTAAVVTMATMAVALFNWGLGLIFGAILARKVGEKFNRENRKLNYPLIGAAAYSGLMVWHGGISGSAPIKAAESGNLQSLVAKVDGIDMSTIPERIDMSTTIFSGMNIVVSILLLTLIPTMMYFIGKRKSDEGTLPEPIIPNEDGQLKLEGAEKLDHSIIFSSIVGGLIICYAFYKAVIAPSDDFYLSTNLTGFIALVTGLILLFQNKIRSWAGKEQLKVKPFANGLFILIGAIAFLIGFYLTIVRPNGLTLEFLTPNFINFFLLGLGIVLHFSIGKFIKAANEAIVGATGILLQFPLYFGILGLMVGSGLINEISDFFVSVSSSDSFPIYTFFSAGLVNVFVPSGGGQWAVQGPIIIASAQELGVSLPKAIMALSYGDQLTNMIQPFWALPLLGITGLKAKEILPYTLLLFLGGGIIFLLGLTLF